MIGVSIESILQQVAQLFIDRNPPAAFSPEPELSVMQAADLLNVSASFVEKLLANGELQTVVATQPPALKLADVLAYKERSDAEAAAILDELTAQILLPLHP